MSSALPGGAVVLDASAVLALLLDEQGAGMVRAHLLAGVVGAVNLAEVLAKLSDHGLPVAEAARAVALLGLEVAPLTEAQALRSAELRRVTRPAGLSLGDRACLALAAERGAPALTADRTWGTVADAAGVSVQVIR